MLFDRANAPRQSIFLLRLADGARTLAHGPISPAALARVLEREGVGLRGRVSAGEGDAPNQFSYEA